jgi:hypothetical protein
VQKNYSGVRPVQAMGAESLDQINARRNIELKKAFEDMFKAVLTSQLPIDLKKFAKSRLIDDKIELLAFWEEPEEIVYETKKTQYHGPKNKKRLFRVPVNSLPGVIHVEQKIERELREEQERLKEFE